MSKMIPAGASVARGAPQTAHLLDRIASTLGCEPSTFFQERAVRQDQTDEMFALWAKLSSTKERETILAFMREHLSRAAA